MEVKQLLKIKTRINLSLAEIWIQGNVTKQDCTHERDPSSYKKLKYNSLDSQI